MPSRRRARIIAVQIFYSMTYTGRDVDDAAAAYFALERDRKSPLPPYALELIQAAREHLAEIDALIDKHLTGWQPERVTATDRTILRLACAEMLYRDDIPPKVTLDEFVEMARLFGDETAYAFVNGVLDAVFHGLAPNAPAGSDESDKPDLSDSAGAPTA